MRSEELTVGSAAVSYGTDTDCVSRFVKTDAVVAYP